MTYVYDHEGNRKEKTVNGVTSTFMVEGGLVKYVRTGNKGTWYYYDAGGAPVGVALGSPIRRYLYRKDLQGDITGIYSGNTGELLVSYVYDAWGKPEITDEAQTEESAELIARNCLLYRGYFYDHETGLYYLQSRYYDPEVGRFLNADVFASTDTNNIACNMFAYCENDPVNQIDPDGYVGFSSKNIMLMMTDGSSSDGYLLFGIAVAFASVVSQRKKETKSITVSLPKAKTKEKTESNNYSYWAAHLINKEVVISDPLTFREACDRVSMGGSVMCKDEESAMAIVIANRYHNWVGPEKSNKTGAFPHFHPSRNHKGYDSIHIWFYEH